MSPRRKRPRPATLAGASRSGLRTDRLTRLTQVTFRVRGIPVAVGPSILIGLLVLGVLSGLKGAFLAEWIVLGFLALLLHELGHALAFRRYGVESAITFWLLGGLTIPTDLDAAERLSERQMLAVTLAGPAVGLVIGAATLAIGMALNLRDAAEGIREPVFLWLFVNLAWALFNLMPISSLDGGGAIEHLAGAAFGRAGRAIGLAACILASGLIALVAAEWRLYSIAVVAVVFGLLNPGPYRQLLDEIGHRVRSDRSSG